MDSIGVVNDAGIRVEEVSSPASITPSSLGVTGLVGILDKGPVDELINPMGLSDIQRQTGGYVAESLLPDAVRDFADHARGAGELQLVRVTDGTEVVASKTVYNMDILAGIPYRSQSKLRGEVGLFKGHSPGTWAGPARKLIGALASTATLTNTTIDISVDYPSLLKNELEGAYLSMIGIANKTYRILSNTIAGVCTVAADSKMLAEFTGTDYTYFIEVKNEDADALERGAKVVFKAGKLDYDYEFGMDIYEHGSLVNSFSDLSLNSASEHFVDNVLEAQSDNYDVLSVTSWTGSIAPKTRPGIAYLPTVVNPTSLTILPYEYQITTGNANGYLSDFALGSDAREDRIVCTFSSPTAFAVTSTFMRGLPAGTVGSTWHSGVNQGIDFKLNAGSILFEADDVVTIDVRPLTTNALKNKLIYVDAFGTNNRSAFRAISNTQTVISFRSSDDISAIAAAPTAGTVTGATAATLTAALIEGSVGAATFDTTTNKTFEYEVNGVVQTPIVVTSGGTTPIATIISDLTTGFGGVLVPTITSVNKVTITHATAGSNSSFKILDGTLNVALGYTNDQTYTGTATFNTSTNKTFKYKINGGAEQTITLTSGASTPLATILTDLNTDLVFLTGLVATATAAYKITITSLSLGLDTFFEITTGLFNTPAGFTPAITYGAGGNLIRIEAPIALQGGYDGKEGVAASHYENVFDMDNSLFNDLFFRNKGLVKIAVPGVDTASVQLAGIEYCEKYKFQFRCQTPVSVVTKQAAAAWVNDTLGRNQHETVCYPSYGYYRDPENESAKKLVSLLGAILGMEARTAGEYEGFHKAAAGVKMIFKNLLELQMRDSEVDGEYLNPIGIQVIKRKGPFYYLSGDRNPAVNPLDKWKHERETLSHYMRTIYESYDEQVFDINDPILWGEIKRSIQDFFDDEIRKRALLRYTVKIDEENNTAATMAQGKVIIEIAIKISPTAEQLIFRIGKMGIDE